MAFRKAVFCAAAALVVLATTARADPGPRRVLLLYSYEREFSHNTFARLFRPQLARTSPHPIDFIELSVQALRTSGSLSDEVMLDNLRGALGGRPLDLVVPIGGPAASFAQRHRAELFPQTPTLFAAVDSRFVKSATLSASETAVMVRNDPVQMIDTILRLRPDTKTIMVVIGASPLEQFWLGVVTRAFSPFESRVTFLWTNQLSLPQLLQRAGSLPPRSAIFYGIFSMDATGTPQMEEPVLDALHAAANAPMFGLHSHQLGHGIVGGALLSLDDIARDSAATAVRLLNGEAPARIPPRTLVAGAPTFDARELQRWGIPARRLTADSVIAFNDASAWRLRGATTTAGAVALSQTALAIGLVIGVRRRRARTAAGHDEWNVSGAQAALERLTQRLIQAQEHERAWIAKAIHDDVCQQLTGLTLRLHALGTATEGSMGDVPVEIRELCEQFFSLEREILALSDPVYARLKLLGLVETAQIYCRRQCTEHGLTLAFDAATLDRSVPDEPALTIFRVLQEAIDNAAAHSRASHVMVSIIDTSTGLEVAVADDGVGFDPDAALRGSAVGLVAMRERVRIAGGTCTFISRPGGGTRIVAHVPLAAIAQV
jgi:signal transduction histidine kinase